MCVCMWYIYTHMHTFQALAIPFSTNWAQRLSLNVPKHYCSKMKKIIIKINNNKHIGVTTIVVAAHENVKIWTIAPQSTHTYTHTYHTYVCICKLKSRWQQSLPTFDFMIAHTHILWVFSITKEICKRCFFPQIICSNNNDCYNEVNINVSQQRWQSCEHYSCL